jgi:TRAP-type C4-dicarboxylate transport system substrate-binding protein
MTVFFRRAATLLFLCAATVSAEAGFKISLQYEERNPMARSCAESMVRTSQGFGGWLEVRIPSDQSAEDGSGPDLLLRLETPSQFQFKYRIPPLLEVPFAFLDPAHFAAFQRSPLFQQLRPMWFDRESDKLLAYAYGGFTHVFTRDKPITDEAFGPVRELRPMISNILSLVPDHSVVYMLGGASSDIMNFDEDFAPVAKLADVARKTARAANANPSFLVPLSAALEAGLSTANHYLTLLPAFVTPVLFVVPRDGLKSLERIGESALQTWLDAVALDCSRANYEIEFRALQAFREAGLHIAQVDRAPLAGEFWADSLVSNRIWSSDEFDQLFRLSNSPIKIVPSQLLTRFSNDAIKYKEMQQSVNYRRELQLLRIGLRSDPPEAKAFFEKTLGLRLSTDFSSNVGAVRVDGYMENASNRARQIKIGDRIPGIIVVGGTQTDTPTLQSLWDVVDQSRRRGDKAALFLHGSSRTELRFDEVAAIGSAQLETCHDVARRFGQEADRIAIMVYLQVVKSMCPLIGRDDIVTLAVQKFSDMQQMEEQRVARQKSEDEAERRIQCDIANSTLEKLRQPPYHPIWGETLASEIKEGCAVQQGTVYGIKRAAEQHVNDSPDMNIKAAAPFIAQHVKNKQMEVHNLLEQMKEQFDFGNDSVSSKSSTPSNRVVPKSPGRSERPR